MPKNCSRIEDDHFKFNVQKMLIKETKLWNYFALKLALVILGIITNSVCLAVFIHSKYINPIMGKLISLKNFKVIIGNDGPGLINPFWSKNGPSSL